MWALLVDRQESQIFNKILRSIFDKFFLQLQKTARSDVKIITVYLSSTFKSATSCDLTFSCRIFTSSLVRLLSMLRYVTLHEVKESAGGDFILRLMWCRTFQKKKPSMSEERHQDEWTSTSCLRQAIIHAIMRYTRLVRCCQPVHSSTVALHFRSTNRAAERSTIDVK